MNQDVWYDYTVQAWVVDGKYADCAHKFACGCYGRDYAGEIAPPENHPDILYNE